MRLRLRVHARERGQKGRVDVDHPALERRAPLEQAGVGVDLLDELLRGGYENLRECLP